MKTDLAKKYNNESVLENMHYELLMDITKDDGEFDFLSIMYQPGEKQKKQHARKYMKRLILATDIAQHFKNLALFVDRRKGTKPDIQKLDFNNSLEDRYVLCFLI